MRTKLEKLIDERSRLESANAAMKIEIHSLKNENNALRNDNVSLRWVILISLLLAVTEFPAILIAQKSEYSKLNFPGCAN